MSFTPKRNQTNELDAQQNEQNRARRAAWIQIDHKGHEYKDKDSKTSHQIVALQANPLSGFSQLFPQFGALYFFKPTSNSLATSQERFVQHYGQQEDNST